MSVKIDRIILKVSGKEIELSVDEAKQLKDILGEMFGKDNTVVIPTLVPYPYIQPYYPDRLYPSYSDYPIITWSCTSSGTDVILTNTDGNS